MNCEKMYQAVKKCVINDYPFEISWDDTVLFPLFEETYDMVLEDHSHINNSYYSNNDGGVIRLEYLDHYVILCYRFANALWKAALSEIADAVYYSMRVRGSIDLYYRTEIGRCFIAAHALGTAMDAHSTYGAFFRIYNGCHIGPFSLFGKKPSEWVHPKFGNFVTMLAHSKVYGQTVIGNNVIISAQTLIINETIPDNCIVSGSSPNLFFKPLKPGSQGISKNL